MKTPEEILDECTINRFDETDKNTFIKAMKIYANQKLDAAANLSQEMIYEREPQHSQKQGMVLRNFQTCLATAKQSILQLKDKTE